MSLLDGLRTSKCVACGKRARASRFEFAAWSLEPGIDGAEDVVVQQRRCPFCGAVGSTSSTVDESAIAAVSSSSKKPGFFETFRDVQRHFFSESALGRRCSGCGVREWPWRYTNTQIDSYKEGDWWNRKTFTVIETMHPACGHRWRETRDVTPRGV